ncbi:hypothetical protein P9112_011634 [Eukaryota sp. TZLM1-RC]
MAQSKYEYVRQFEMDDTALPQCFIVVRIDGRCFHQFADLHNFTKPSDDRALHLMNAAAAEVMTQYRDIFIGYGQSDEYSFILQPSAKLFKRRQSKIATTIVSLFSAAYVASWNKYFDYPMQSIPSFDSRCILYPSYQTMRDYLSWRQVDCHINNLYNYCFWKLVDANEVNGGLDPKTAENFLSTTVSADKNELLFSKFGINYNNLPLLHRKGTVLFWQQQLLEVPGKVTPQGEVVKRWKPVLQVKHCDLIRDDFWEKNDIKFV